MIKRLLTTAVCVTLGMTASGQKLEKFGADLGKKTVMGKDIRVPYTEVTNYFGYIKPGTAPDEIKNGKKMYYVYIWIPAAAPEIGVRMISPVPEGMKPSGKDVVSGTYAENATDTKNYFDTWVTFERAIDVAKIDDVAARARNAKWYVYDSNDDSSELPAQPSGSKYNSLMRVTSNPDNAMRSLVMGLYRIGFTTYKTGEVQGSFVAQVGAPVKLPGVAVSANPAELASLAKK